MVPFHRLKSLLQNLKGRRPVVFRHSPRRSGFLLTLCMLSCSTRMSCGFSSFGPGHLNRHRPRSRTFHVRSQPCRFPHSTSLVDHIVTTGTGMSTTRNFQRQFTSKLFLESKQTSPNAPSDEALSLEEEILRAYEENETDGILQLLPSPEESKADNARWEQLQNADMDLLIPNLFETFGYERKGDVASILNGLMGTYCLMKTTDANHSPETEAEILGNVENILRVFDDLQNNPEHAIKPDVVTFSLAYHALQHASDSSSIELADYVLDLARRDSKKIAGGKRRKVLASARRKKTAITCADVEDDLKGLLGEDFAILQETNDFVVINKPSGVSCFHKHKTTAGKISNKKKSKNNNKPNSKGDEALSTMRDISLEDAFLSCNIPLSTLNPDALGLVHRLDRGSSGCMVLAKTDEMHAHLVASFFLRQTTKTYVTFVSPAPDADATPNEGYITSPVDDRPAKSKYRVIERYGSDNEAAKVEFDIFTGRKHQVRVHAAEGLSSPVLLDHVYTTTICQERNEISRQTSLAVQQVLSATEEVSHAKAQQFFLHACRLSIPEYDIDATAPVPSWWETPVSFLQKELSLK